MSFLHPIKDPVEGVAHVVGVSAVDPQYMRQPCTMQLVIQAQGVAAFPLKQDFEIWTNQWPDTGDQLPVTFDREHPERIKIHWDQVPTGAETAEADAQAMAAQLNAAAPGGPVGAPPSVGADPLDRLAKLADLHTSGALTDAEFATEKAKILRDV
jgi:Short C-terminal domain